MHVRGRSLFRLGPVLYGYGVACAIHGDPAGTDFDPVGPFSEWFWPRLGLGYECSLGWTVEVERAGGAAGVPRLDGVVPPWAWTGRRPGICD